MVLLAGLVLSVFAWKLIERETERQSRARFSRLQEHVLAAMDARFTPVEQALYAGRTVVEMSERLPAEAWQKFSVGMQPFFDHGVVGIGYVERVARGDLPELEQRMRASGYPDFTAERKGDEDPVYIVTHLEPLALNRAALGKDVGSGVTRRIAAEESMRTGLPVITKTIQVVEGVGTAPGSLLFLPVYRTLPPSASPDQRTAASRGWVYAVLRVDLLLGEVIADTEDEVAIAVSDGEEPGKPMAVISPTSVEAESNRPPKYTATINRPVFGRQWQIQLNTTPVFERRSTRALPWLVLIGGAIVSVFAATLTLTLLHSRGRALERARHASTSLDRAEAELRKLAMVASRTANAVVITDDDWRIEWANDSFLRFFGFTFDEIKGRRPGEILHGPDTSASTLQAINDACDRGEPFRGEMLNYTKSGAPRWVELDIQPVKDERGRVRGYLALQLDITERKRIQESLAQTEAEFRFIFESAPIGLSWLWVGPDGSRRRLTNDAYLKILGLTREQLDEPNIFARISDPEEWRRQLVFLDRLERGEIDEFSVEKKYRHSDGTWVHADLTLHRFRNANGGFQQVATLVDLTLLKEQAMELSRAKDAAEAANRAKSQFLAMMSHEIRTPMNGVIGMTSLLIESGLTPRQRDYVETIRNSGDTLLTIINDILDFSKIESNRLELEWTEFAVPLVIGGALDLLAPKAAEKKLKFGHEIDADVPSRVRGDPTRLRQILVNLVGNAVKFTSAGQVNLAVKVAGRDASRAELLFAVRDTGIGIPPEAMSRLFQSFSQVDASTSRRFGGTGLGLVISKRLAEMMGGRMWVESEVDRGSTFYFTIVVDVANSVPPFALPSANPAMTDIAAPAAQRPERILIAEDNAVNQKVAALMLEKLGFRADVAADGREVLEAVKRQRYDIIMMDVQMPEMDGLAAAQEISRLFPERSDRPWIIAVTANAMRTDREACLVAGMDDYISKPVIFEELAAALDRGCAAMKVSGPV